MSSIQNTDEDSRESIRMISVGEVAKILDISIRTVWRLVSAKKIVPPIKVGGVVRWRYHELRQWVDAGCPEQLPVKKPR